MDSTASPLWKLITNSGASKILFHVLQTQTALYFCRNNNAQKKAIQDSSWIASLIRCQWRKTMKMGSQKSVASVKGKAGYRTNKTAHLHGRLLPFAVAVWKTSPKWMHFQSNAINTLRNMTCRF